MLIHIYVYHCLCLMLYDRFLLIPNNLKVMLDKVIDLLKSAYFCFKYLPFKQAVKLPIILYGAHFDDLKGNVRIESESVYRGMIKLGVPGVCLFYPHRGVTWQNHGGNVVFKGKVSIGAGCAISVNSKANLIFGDDFLNTYGLKIIASRTISFGKSNRFGWNTFVMDTNMHPLKDKNTKKKGRGGASIKIGDYNWFSTNCVILPGVETPERVMCGLGTVVTRNVEWKPYCLYGGSPIRLLRENVYRDLNDDKDDMVYG